MSFPAWRYTNAPSASVPASRRLLWGLGGSVIGLLWGLTLWHRWLASADQSDVWWSWALGHWELTHHALYRTNRFNGLTAPYIDLEWGWQALIAALAPHGIPSPGLIALLWAAALFGWWILAHLATRLYGASPLTDVLAGLPLMLLAANWVIRPQILSFSLWLLLLAGLSTTSWRIWLLVPLTVLWSTLHGDWILMPLLTLLDIGRVLWTGRGQPLVRSDLDAWTAARTRLAVLGVTLAAVLVCNPLHGAVLTTATQLSGNPLITAVIQEWHSPIWTQPVWTVLALLWFGVGGLAVAHRLPQGPWLFWWSGTVLATLWHQRMALYNVPLTVLLLMAAIVSPRSTQTHPSGQWHPAIRRVFRIGLASGLGVLTISTLVHGSARYQSAMRVPTPLLVWCQQHPTAGLTLTPYRDGGLFEAHGVPRVWLDGRTLFWIQHDRLLPYLRWQAGSEPVTRLTVRGITRIIWPTTPTTPQTLWLQRAHWQAVYHANGLTVWQPPARPSPRY